MTLKEAKALRDDIRSTAGLHCVVPLGYGPASYFARIFTARGMMDGAVSPVDFHSRDAWLEWRDMRQQEHERERLRRQLLSQHRSPIEVMIDKACGLE